MTAEPIFISGQKPEAVLQRAIVAAIREIAQMSNYPIVIVERFGLDVMAFVGHTNGPQARLLELKAFVGGRAGGVGFGNGAGRGAQVDLLWDHENGEVRSSAELEILNNSVRWILADGTRPVGTARYAIFTCSEAQKAAMGGVRPDKQNNLRISAFENHMLTWEALLNHVRGFLSLAVNI